MARLASRDGWLASLLDMHERRARQLRLLRHNDSLGTLLIGCLALGIGSMISIATVVGLMDRVTAPWTEREIYYSLHDTRHVLPIRVITPTRYATVVGVFGGIVAAMGIVSAWRSRRRLAWSCILGLTLCAAPILVAFLAMIFVVV
jgi:hypothetical protein